MRAQIEILTRVQLPFTIMGMPPALVPAVVLFSVAFLLAGFAFGYPSIGFVLAVVFALGSSAYVSIANMRDPHHFASSARVRAFWQGRKRRVFLAGASPRSVNGHSARRSRRYVN